MLTPNPDQPNRATGPRRPAHRTGWIAPLAAAIVAAGAPSAAADSASAAVTATAHAVTASGGVSVTVNAVSTRGNLGRKYTATTSGSRRVVSRRFYHPVYGDVGTYYAYPEYTGFVVLGSVTSDGTVVDTGTLVDLARQIDPQLIDPQYKPGTEQAAPPEPDPLDEARALVRAGRYDRAIEALTTLAEAEQTNKPAGPDATPSRDVTRLLGFVHALAGDMASAGEALAVAYDEDPSLARQPLRGNAYVTQKSDLRRVVQKASAYAANRQTHDAWLTVAVLMHAEGRHKLANRTAAKAVEIRKQQEVPDDATTHTDLPDIPGATARAASNADTRAAAG